MSTVNKRKLAEATHALVHTNALDLEHFEAVGGALAQVFTDLMGVNCTVVFKVSREEAAALLAAQGKEPS